MTNAEAAALLTQMREAAELTQDEIAERLGHRQSWAQRLEAGKQQVRVETLAEWAHVCHVHLRVSTHSVEEALSLELHDVLQQLGEVDRDRLRDIIRHFKAVPERNREAWRLDAIDWASMAKERQRT